jgi:hypothetical protein
MNDPGHPTHYQPEYRELAHNYCLLGATNPHLAEFFGEVPRTIDNSIVALGRTALGNTTCGVLLFSRPFIPVRKNYLTQRADACSLTSGRYSRAKGQHRRHAGGARCRRGTGVP